LSWKESTSATLSEWLPPVIDAAKIKFESDCNRPLHTIIELSSV